VKFQISDFQFSIFNPGTLAARVQLRRLQRLRIGDGQNLRCAPTRDFRVVNKGAGPDRAYRDLGSARAGELADERDCYRPAAFRAA
jgi:hypothetical protein